MKLRNVVFSLLAALTLLPQVVLAVGTAYEFSWVPASNDLSIKYLGQIFGTMSTALAGTGNALMGNLFTIFNIAVLTLGSIVVTYTIIMSTMHTAQEGEVMGKKWSSMWIPLRSALGMAMLLPTASGYSLLQVLMMNIVVLGIAAADNIWAQIVVTMASTTGTGVTGSIRVHEGQLSSATNALLKSMVCANVLNTNASCQTKLNNATVTAYSAEDRSVVVSSSPGSFPTPQTIISSKMLVGTQNNSVFAEVCGGLKPGPKPANAESQASWSQANMNGFGFAASMLLSTANQIVNNTYSLSGDPSAELTYAKNILKGSITSAPAIPPQTNMSGAMTSALHNGWLFAGSYYFVMISSGSNLQYPAPTVIIPSQKAVDELGGTCRMALTIANQRLANYTRMASAGSSLASSSLNLPTNSSAPGVAKFMDAIAKPLRNEVDNFMRYLTTNDPRGPLASLAAVGTDILVVAQNIWFAVIIVGLVLMLAGCTMSGIQPLCFALGAIIGILCTVLNFIIALLWGVGAMLGLYMPLIPYIVFTFTSLGWFILVIETIVAAPIVALGLVSPAGEHLGKASPAVVLIANVFLRPSLMLIGLIAATYLVNAVVGMFNYGFTATVDATVSGLGIFGLISLLILYGSTVIALIHESFSLIYVLPDKIMRWIGGHAEQSKVKEHLESAKKSVEKGAEMGGEYMRGSAGYMQQKGEASMKKGTGLGGGGGGAPGGGGGGAPGGGSGAPGGGGGLQQ